MEILRKFCLVGILLIFFINLASGISQISISVDPVFYEGDEIKFLYTFFSFEDEVVKYTVGINCDGESSALLEIEEVHLRPNEPFQEEYIYGNVNTELIQAEICIASLIILEPYDMIKEEAFRVENLPELTFELKICKDQSCTEKSKVFIQGETIYLDYSSDIENPEVSATLVYPDDKTESITFPHSFTAQQIRTYELEVTASKEGYKTITKKEQFGVIEGNADIQGGIIDDGKGEPEKIDIVKIIKYLVYFLAIILVILVFYLLLMKKRNR